MKIQPLSNWNARKVIINTILVSAVAVGFWLLYRYRLVLLIFFSAVILGTAFKPLVEWFHKRGFSRLVSLVFVYLATTLIIASICWIAIPILFNQSFELAGSIPQIYQDLRSTLLKSPSMILNNLGWNMPLDIRLILAKVPQETRNFDTVTRLLNYTGTLLNALLVSIAIFLITSLWILEGDRAIRTIFHYFPKRLRETGQIFINDIQIRLGAFVRGQLFLCLIIAFLAFVSYIIIGLPNTLVLAIIAGLFEAVPIFGPALGSVPAIFIAYSIDPGLILWVIVSTIIIQQLENYLLVPRVMGSAVGVNPILTLLVLATFTTFLGLPGALLAIPSAAIIQLFLNRFVFSSDPLISQLQEGRDKVSAIRYEILELIDDVRRQIRQKKNRSSESNDHIEDSVELIALELDDLLRDSSSPEVSS